MTRRSQGRVLASACPSDRPFFVIGPGHDWRAPHRDRFHSGVHTPITSSVDGARTRWVVDFWLDPACPLTRHTARWLTLVAEHRPVEIRWRVMSLAVLNEHRDDDPEGDTEGFLWIPARVAAAVQTEHGHAALGAFYDALWTDATGAEREWIDDLSEALVRAGLPAELADAGTSTEYDAALRASHRAGVDRIDAEVGTPVLAITTPDGQRHALFGPVLTAVPGLEEALRIWDGTLMLAGAATFREIKR